MNPSHLYTRTANERLGIKAKTKYAVYGYSVRRGTTFFQIQSSDGRPLNVTLGKGLIANFIPVVRGDCVEVLRR